MACDGNELDYVREVLESGWLTTGKVTRQLEESFGAAVGARHACAVNSCTAALHLALDAVGVGPGDKVLVPTMTFTATAEVVRYVGADPVFLDVEYETSLMTPEIVERALDENPTAKVLVVVHFAGQSADMRPGQKGGILDICRSRGVRVVEDAAHAFPASECGQPVGSLGDVTCFSFYANKTITTGEGGMLVTNDDEIHERATTMRLHGIDRDVWKRFTAEKASWEYDVIAPGYKYNMPDLNAAVGLAQLERAREMRTARQRCAQYYLDRLADVDALDLPRSRVAAEDHAWHLFPVVLREFAPLSRDALIDALAERGVGTSVHYKPLHRMSYYKKRYDLRAESFPNAERIWSGCLSLPLFPTLKEEELDRVCATFQDLLAPALV